MARSAVSVRYPVRPRLEDWVLPEGTVPESVPHDRAADYLRDVLRAFADRCGRPVFVARNLAIRWVKEAPQIGIDPDVCVLDPPPPGVEDLQSLCLWKEGHFPPPLCIEIVSKNHPHKDYVAIQDRYAAMGTRELFVFDPLLAGPAALGGPVPLQLWRRDEIGVFERSYSGEEPVFSEVLNAWFIPNGRLLTVADDKSGHGLWLTVEERERADKERAQAEKDRVQAEKDRVQAEKDRVQAEMERERVAREDLERRLRDLEAKAQKG